MTTATPTHVITYESSHGARRSLCDRHEQERTQAGDWPRDSAGEELCKVYRGSHLGICDDCDSHHSTERDIMTTAETHEIRDHAGRVLGHLTADHAASSRAIPVLVIEGRAYGPEDVVDYVDEPAVEVADAVAAIASLSDPLGLDAPTEPRPRTAAEWVRHYVEAMVSEALPHDQTTRDLDRAARAFLGH